MFKMVFLLARKDGTTPEEFTAYYETVHRHFIHKIPGVANYLRRYVKPLTPGGETKIEYDCITEVWFEDADAFKTAQEATRSQAFRKMIADDEDNFLDRSKTRVFTVEEQTW